MPSAALWAYSAENYFNFGIAERLRAFRYPIFTGGVVEGNDICNAAFCESAALRESAAGHIKTYTSQRQIFEKSVTKRCGCGIVKG